MDLLFLSLGIGAATMLTPRRFVLRGLSSSCVSRRSLSTSLHHPGVSSPSSSTLYMWDRGDGVHEETSLSLESLSSKQRLQNTKKWVETVVLGQKLCPFVKSRRLKLRSACCADDNALIRIVGEEASFIIAGLRNTDADDAMAATDSPETTLIVLDESRSWMDLVSLSWRLQQEALIDNRYNKMLQLVLFHPDAVHSKYAEGPDDAADYSIRSPYPTIHLLREIDVLKAVKGYKDVELIPARNKQRLRYQGIDACAGRLRDCIRATLGEGDGK